MIRLFLLILVFNNGIITNCFSQKQERNSLRSISLRTNLFSFVELDAGIMVGVKYQINERFAAMIDPMFIFYDPYDNHQHQPLGIKVKSDFRYYLDKYRPGRDRFFIAPELHLKYVSTKKIDDFGFNCISGQCSYYMNAQYREVKSEAGGSVKLGTEIPLDKKETWSLEIYAGFGVKVIHYSEKDIPFGSSFVSTPTHQFPLLEDTPVPMLPGFVKLSFRIW